MSPREDDSVAHSPALLEERELRPTVKTGERCAAVMGGKENSCLGRDLLIDVNFARCAAKVEPCLCVGHRDL